MKTKKILQLPWLPLEDLSKLEASYIPFLHHTLIVSKLDIELFLIDLIGNLSLEFDVSYDEMRELIYRKNVTFFLSVDKLFHKHTFLTIYNSKLLKLQKSLLVPYKLKNSDLNDLIELYENLTPKDKMAFLEYIGNFEVKIKAEVVPKNR